MNKDSLLQQSLNLGSLQDRGNLFADWHFVDFVF